MGNEILEKLANHAGIKRALEFVECKRFSSEIIKIIFPLRPDESTVIATLLHRLYIDNLLNDKLIEKEFGKDVLDILKGAKKSYTLNFAENDKGAQMDILRRMILAMAKDIRVILLILSCRLYHMRHLDELISEDKRVIFAKETLNIHAPIAARLGIYSIKNELEDLSFKYVNPKEYKNIINQLQKFKKGCISFVKTRLIKFLHSKGIEADVLGRMKGIYSIYKKLQRKELNSINDLYDIFAMRIIIPAKEDEKGREILDQLYTVLGLLHSEWKPISKKFKDYIAVPKPNGYRSLHTVVLGLSPENIQQPVEIQIRDTNMHRDAEYGVASHWIYKDQGSKAQVLSAQADWIRGLESIRDTFEIDNGIKDADIDIFKDRIFVLTPKGEVKDLPKGSGPVDFAYAVHTDLGNKCVMAKVNGSAVPLDYELNNGDVVEIITKKDAEPKLRWLPFVKTVLAKHRIKSWFHSQDRDKNIREGKNIINEQLTRIGKPLLDQNYSVLKNYLGKNLSLSEREGLLEEVGVGAKSSRDIIRRIYPYEDFIVKPSLPKKLIKVSEEKQVLIGGEDLPVKFPACCKPEIGDPVIGYVTRGPKVTVHKTVCKMIDALDKNRFISAEWKGKPKYLIGIKVLVAARVGMMRDVISVISAMGINIKKVSIQPKSKGISEERFLLELDNIDQFDLLLDKIENIKDVVKVSRFDAPSRSS